MASSNFPSAATAVALSNAASQASTVTGSAINLMASDYETVLITQNVGAVTGSITGKIQDSPDGSTGWADLTGAAFTAVSSSNNTQTLAINGNETRGYIRYVGTIATGPALVAVTLAGVPKVF